MSHLPAGAPERLFTIRQPMPQSLQHTPSLSPLTVPTSDTTSRAPASVLQLVTQALIQRQWDRLVPPVPPPTPTVEPPVPPAPSPVTNATSATAPVANTAVPYGTSATAPVANTVVPYGTSATAPVANTAVPYTPLSDAESDYLQRQVHTVYPNLYDSTEMDLDPTLDHSPPTSPGVREDQQRIVPNPVFSTDMHGKLLSLQGVDPMEQRRFISKVEKAQKERNRPTTLLTTRRASYEV
jgi:hypothetical protein